MKKIKAALVCALLGTSALSADDVSSAVQKDYSYLDSLYKHLHSNPELSFKEFNTAERIAKELREIGFEVTEKVGRVGVVGVLKNGDGPTVLVRTDLDALPVTEQTGFSFASKAMGVNEAGDTVGVMHACGHDIHMTSFIGTARQLARLKDQWKGTLVFIGQPAEETVGGAQAMLEDGLFERFPKPDYNIALHVSSAMASGTVGMTQGFALANVNSVDIAIKGIGGHGAYPHTTKDPIVLGAQIVTALQTLVSRETSPLDSGVVTVGSFHSGTKHNIISDGAHLQLTVRSYTDEVRENLLTGIKRIAEAQAMSIGLPEDLWPEVTYSQGTPATYNEPDFTGKIHAAMTKKFGEDRVIWSSPVMGAEDFAYYGRTEDRIPSLMFWVGAADPEDVKAANEGKKKLPSLHSPFFKPDYQATITQGVEAMTLAVMDIMAEGN
ncbi:amidohydrolase [Kordiimonas sp. SCSIO 12603]|uniref:amidohydrolase n=1 Tax=Kordiimonas sp. SCSIO 12603 TaxID=2829596 RepID=UPI002102056E|nr:amidohydrolase [Kordiimonas sp. SCSIO 12603]UTW57861.1 amidohydrolase [Kordiimonas sp. SCSIO 12603]